MFNMKHSERAKTIATNGEIIPKPYGPGRWHSPRRYGCKHAGCENPAPTLSRAGTHEWSPGKDSAHNCCSQHDD